MALISSSNHQHQSAEVPVKFGIISKEKILQSSSGISNPSSAATETSADAATMQYFRFEHATLPLPLPSSASTSACLSNAFPALDLLDKELDEFQQLLSSMVSLTSPPHSPSPPSPPSPPLPQF